jgi:predicted dehydrogenase
MAHAPMLAGGPETRLAGVWSRTAASAQRLAAAHGVPVFDRFADLVDACDAVSLAVPPGVQPDLAIEAARAGRALLLEKPLGLDVIAARRLADAVDEAGVGSVVLLTYRFNPVVRDFLADARGLSAIGARACFLSGAFLGGAFAGGWRPERGALLDVGPHLLDLVEAAMGPITEMMGKRTAGEWIGLVVSHQSGAVTDISISCSAAVTPSRTELEVYGRDRSVVLDARRGRSEAWAVLRAEFAETARRRGGHPLDARRGAEIQELVAAAERAVGHNGHT